MKWVYDCRRTFIATLSIGVCAALGFVNGTDVTGSIAAIAMGLAAANAGEAAYAKTKGPDNANVAPEQP